MKYLISACLAGIPCRYDGSACTHPKAAELVARGEAIAFCPETAGGLPIPRSCCEMVIKNGIQCVCSSTGNDYTAAFTAGAAAALTLMREHHLTCAILKSKSPSCGCGEIYDGSFSGQLTQGNGFTAQLLLDNGISVLNESHLYNLP